MLDYSREGSKIRRIALSAQQPHRINRMNSARISLIALSAALMFSVGSSSLANTNYSHPAFSVAEDPVLNMRETGSKIVMETIEDAIRQGGTALLGEGFQLDSSLNYVFGEP